MTAANGACGCARPSRDNLRITRAYESLAVDLPDGTLVRIEVEPADAGFWQNKSVEEMAREQGVAPLESLKELAGGSRGRPTEDSVDELLSFIREVRR